MDSVIQTNYKDVFKILKLKSTCIFFSTTFYMQCWNYKWGFFQLSDQDDENIQEGLESLEGKDRGRKILRRIREATFSQPVEKYLNISTTSMTGSTCTLYASPVNKYSYMAPRVDKPEKQHPFQYGNEFWTRPALAWMNYVRAHYIPDQENNKIFTLNI